MVFTRSSRKIRVLDDDSFISDEQKGTEMIPMLNSDEFRAGAPNQILDDDSSSSEQIPGAPSLKRKMNQILDDDSGGEPSLKRKIDDLPSELKLRILTSLDTKNSASIGTCSNYWVSLMKEINSIDLVVCDDIKRKWVICRGRAYRFIRFMDSTINRMERIQSMSVDFRYDIGRFIPGESFDRKLDGWIGDAIGKGLEQLDIKTVGWISIPHALYCNSGCLRKLNLDCVRIAPMSMVNWTSLKEIYLIRPLFGGNNSLGLLLSGCPILHKFELADAYLKHSLTISSPSMESLLLSDIRFDTFNAESGFIEINTPSLLVFDISGRIIANVRFTKPPSLQKSTFLCVLKTDSDQDKFPVHIDTETWCEMLTQLLISTCTVPYLKLGSAIIQVLSLSKLLGGPSPFFRKCKHVWISSPLWRFDMPGIISLLENGPQLETLFIKVVQLENGMPLTQVMESFENGNPHIPYNSHWKFVHLKTIKIAYPQENMYTECIDVAIISSILTGAVVLEKLVLCSPSGTGSNFCRQQMLKFSELLRTLLTRNKVAEWVLTEMNGTFTFSFLRSI